MPYNKHEKKAELNRILKQYEEEMADLRHQREQVDWDEEGDPFDAEGELKSLIKFYKIAIKLAPKDHKKLKRLHAEISEASNNTLELLMEKDHTFADSKINIISTAWDHYKPGRDGLGEAIRSKGDYMKKEYDMREFLVSNWMEITR